MDSGYQSSMYALSVNLGGVDVRETKLDRLRDLIGSNVLGDLPSSKSDDGDLSVVVEFDVWDVSRLSRHGGNGGGERNERER